MNGTPKHPLFFRKAGYLDRKRQPPSVEAFDDSDAQHYSQDTIESASTGNGVKMGTNEQPRGVRMDPRVVTSQIARRVHGNDHTQRFHPNSQDAVHFPHRRR